MVAYARAHVMKYAIFTVDDIDMANQVTKVRLVPDQPTQSLRVLVPDGTITDTDSATWTLELSGIQDFGSGSLGAAIRTAADAGTSMDIVFQPRTGSGEDKAEFTIKPLHLPFGGDQGSFRVFDATFPVEGEPTFSQST
jgi:hypothetical protein